MSDLIQNLPETWSVSELGELNIHKFGTINPKDFPNEIFEYYSIPDYRRDQRPSTILGGEIESAKLILKPQCVLFGKLNPRVEKVWRVGNSTDLRQIGSTEWIPIFPCEDVDSDFLYFLEWSDHVMPLAKKLVSGSTPSRQRVDPKSFYKIKVPLPPLPEQKKIAHILSTVQRAIEAQERIIQTTTELKKALMQKLFTEGLRGEPQKQTEVGQIPESWEVKKVGEIADLKSGGTPSRKNPEFWDNGSIPWVKTGEVDYCTITDTEEKITEAGLEQSSAKLFPAGTLIMAMYGQGITRGKVAILGIEASTNQACVAFFPNKEIDSKYLYFYFEYSYDEIRNFAHGANQKNLSAEIIKTYPVIYPKDKGEQREIAGVLEELDRKNQIHHKKKRVYQDLFRTLLHELMTAKVRVNNIDPQEKEASA